MTKETAAKIREKLTEIDVCIERIEACSILINAIIEAEEFQAKQPDTFLAEMNATNDQEPQGEYGVTMVVEAPPSVPDLDDLTPLNPAIEMAKEVLGMEQDGPEEPLATVDDAFWLRCVKTIMLAGWTMEKLLKSEPCKGVAFTKAETELLKNLECLRYTMKGKDIDLNGALGQDWVTPVEADVIREFAETNKLK